MQRPEKQDIYPRITNQIVSPMTPEPFVSAEQAAQFLSLKRRYLLALARKGITGAYALGTGTVRKIWVFRLSELAQSPLKKGNMTHQRGSLQIKYRKNGETWILRYRVTASDGRRVENTIPVGLLRDFPKEKETE